MYTALLDTCVLWPSLQRDALLSFAVEGIYRPTWSSAILEELEYHEAIKLVRRGAEAADAKQRASYLINRMRTAFNDAEVQGWERLDGTFNLPDRDDEHVVAAAVIGGAGAIVTHNMKDFPASLLPATIEVLSPAEFAHNTVSVDPMAATRAIKKIADRSGRAGPRLTSDEILDLLADRYGFDDAVTVIRESI
jgi:hypothetical protein